MLLNQFKTGSVAAPTLGGSRGSAVVLRKVKNMGKPETVKATASGSEGAASPGWLETNLGKATSYVDKKLHSDGSGAKGASDMVEYKGTAVVVKKLKMLDLIDRVADAQDDAAELLQGKKVSIQLMSGEIDPSMSTSTSQQFLFMFHLNSSNASVTCLASRCVNGPVTIPLHLSSAMVTSQYNLVSAMAIYFHCIALRHFAKC